MIKTEIITNTNGEQREIERKLKETGYKKTSDCMWIKIYTKNNIEITISRNW